MGEGENSWSVCQHRTNPWVSKLCFLPSPAHLPWYILGSFLPILPGRPERSLLLWRLPGPTKQAQCCLSRAPFRLACISNTALATLYYFYVFVHCNSFPRLSDLPPKTGTRTQLCVLGTHSTPRPLCMSANAFWTNRQFDSTGEIPIFSVLLPHTAQTPKHSILQHWNVLFLLSSWRIFVLFPVWSCLEVCAVIGLARIFWWTHLDTAATYYVPRRGIAKRCSRTVIPGYPPTAGGNFREREAWLLGTSPSSWSTVPWICRAVGMPANSDDLREQRTHSRLFTHKTLYVKTQSAPKPFLPNSEKPHACIWQFFG